MTAEFHTTNPIKQEYQSREEVIFPEPISKPYKAIVYVMFSGGTDSYNMLISRTCEQKNTWNFACSKNSAETLTGKYIPILQDKVSEVYMIDNAKLDKEKIIW